MSNNHWVHVIPVVIVKTSASTVQLVFYFNFHAGDLIDFFQSFLVWNWTQFVGFAEHFSGDDGRH